MRKVLDFCERVMIYLSVISTFLLMLLTTVDAACRYLFNSPITGAYEITTNYLMVAAVFLGLSYGYRNGAYIRVTFVSRHFTGNLKLIANHFVQVITLIYGCILIFATYKQVILTFEMHTSLSSLDFIPLGPAYVIVPAGLFFMSLSILFDISKVRKHESPLFVEVEGE